VAARYLSPEHVAGGAVTVMGDGKNVPPEVQGAQGAGPGAWSVVQLNLEPADASPAAVVEE
jgi:hypothetical protein